jgi:hypothetical protein
MPGKWLYLEFLIPVKDYMTTLKFREFCFEWCLPCLTAIFTYLFVFRTGTYSNSEDSIRFAESLLNVLGILFGFSIASLTLLTTVSNDGIERIKNSLSKNRKIHGKTISVYQLTIITFTFLLILEIFGILVNFIYILIALFHPDFWALGWEIFYALDVGLAAQIIAINLRNTSNIYLVFVGQFGK